MIDQAQVEFAKTFWEQSRTAVLQAHQAWDLVMRSQKTMMDSMRNTGAPFALAADQFDKLMEFHSNQYNAALEYMDKMSAEYQRLLAQNKT
ncbi:hypothetical protein [Noviherbaspirillum sp. Root189]|uniref:hypothetical protein n=1 Tax=Noviherbaspirillum sp. Root189 TaxID=1736487 RepID=UPI00070F9E25|nr:hypothetical protein [Noviherbaspirillum sp. Root189]KRB86964.1 hypothetical protein ASE07_20360 [Noviherbaspirillum sp. Root189]